MNKNNQHSRVGSAAAKQASDASADLKQHIGSVYQTAREAFDDTKAHVREAVGETATHVKDAASEAADHMRETAQGYYETGREQLRQAEKSIETRIREKPLVALSIAVGAGMLVGLMWGRR